MSSFVFKDEKHSGFHVGNHDDAMSKIQQKQQNWTRLTLIQDINKFSRVW